MSSLDLYWIPLGAGARVVRLSGGVYERLRATIEHRQPRDLYHTALIATTSAATTVIEMTPIPDPAGRRHRGVVAEGPVGLRALGRLRLFRYEIRRWPAGIVDDLDFAVSSPVHISDDRHDVESVLELVARVPTPVWGRDELGAGEMWNSNSVTSWLLTRAGLVDAAGPPPGDGRAPGWDAGVRVALDEMAAPDPPD